MRQFTNTIFLGKTKTTEKLEEDGVISVLFHYNSLKYNVFKSKLKEEVLGLLINTIIFVHLKTYDLFTFLKFQFFYFSCIPE